MAIHTFTDAPGQQQAYRRRGAIAEPDWPL